MAPCSRYRPASTRPARSLTALPGMASTVVASATRDRVITPGAFPIPAGRGRYRSRRVAAADPKHPERVAIVAVVVLVVVNARDHRRALAKSAARHVPSGPPEIVELSPQESDDIAPAGSSVVRAQRRTSPGSSSIDGQLIPQDQVSITTRTSFELDVPAAAGQDITEFAQGRAHGDDRVVAGHDKTDEEAKAQQPAAATTVDLQRRLASRRSGRAAPRTPASSRIVTPSSSAFVELRARALPDHDVARLLRHAAGHLAAARGDLGRGFVARAALERTGEHERQSRERRRRSARPRTRPVAGEVHARVAAAVRRAGGCDRSRTTCAMLCAIVGPTPSIAVSVSSSAATIASRSAKRARAPAPRSARRG